MKARAILQLQFLKTSLQVMNANTFSMVLEAWQVVCDVIMQVPYWENFKVLTTLEFSLRMPQPTIIFAAAILPFLVKWLLCSQKGEGIQLSIKQALATSIK